MGSLYLLGGLSYRPELCATGLYIMERRHFGCLSTSNEPSPAAGICMNKLFIRSLKAIFSIILSVSAAMGALADDYPKSMSFLNIMEDRSVSLGEVEAIVQDNRGFIWLGGRDGLARFDGYDLQLMSVQSDPNDPEKLEKMFAVVDLFEDSRHDLWAATRSGLFKYDRDKDVFVKLEPQNGQPVEIYQTTASSIAEAPTGEILVGAYAGLNVIDPATLNVIQLMHEVDIPETVSSNTISDIVVDRQENVVWLSTEAGLDRMDWATKKVTRFKPDASQPNSLPDNSVTALEQDEHGNMWVGVRKGLYRFDKQTHAFKRYRHNADDHYSLGGDYILDLFVDNNGWLWIGTDTGGLSLYDAHNDRFIRFQSDGSKGALATNALRKIYQDRIGDMWVGTYPSGVNYHDQSTAAFSAYKVGAHLPNGLLNDYIGAVLEDHEGNIWIGGGGATRIDAKTGEFTHYRAGNDENAKITSGSVISGYVDSQGTVWLGTWAGGLHRYNSQTDRFDLVPHDETLAKTGLKTSKVLNDNVIWDIFEDNQKNLWIATHNGGLSRFDRDTHTFTIYEQDLSNPAALPNQLVWSVMEDSKGRFWVGTASGLELMDREQGNFKHYRANVNPPNGLTSDSIMSMFEDSKGRLWFGSDSGLYLYQEESDSFKKFNSKDGFADNGVRSIIEDENGSLWLGTNNGVVMFNPDTLKVSNYQTYNGEKIGGLNNQAIVANRRGEVMFGGVNGVQIFDTRKLGTNPYVPPVVVTDFRIFTRPVPINGPDEILSKAISQTDHLTLDYKKTMISFGFTALNYRSPDKNQYAYKLEGFDDEWRYVENQRTALYTNLNAGAYTFRIKASNNDGLWNEQGTAIVIKQLPPPWKTWWAYTIYALIFVAIIARFVQVQHKKRRLIEEQNRILEKRVAERTAELREKNNNIQAMLSNMRQGLFTVEPSGTVHQEYSRHLETIFETTDVAGCNAVELLFAGAEVGGDSLDQAKEAINSIIGEDEMNFDFNSHLLPQEYPAVINGRKKFLALDWNPIVVDDMVGKLMVSVRDVTELKQMESEAQAKQRELDIVSQLLNIPARKYLSFVETANKFIAENRRFVSAKDAKDEQVVALLFRNMHTIKGNSRTFGFDYISNVAHQAESVYSTMKASADTHWPKEVMLADLALLESVIGEYQAVYFDVLGRGDTPATSRDQNGFWADEKTISTILQCIQSVEERFPAVREVQQLRPIHHLLDRALSSPLSAILADIVNSLPSIAEQLGKAPPKVVIEDGQVRIKKSSEELINNVFSHVLRNCVDHGIEIPEVRLGKGKDEHGSIDIRCSIEGDRLCIHTSDDGQGLNLSRLYKKGLEVGLWQNGASPTGQQIGELIFASGVSTKDQVTDISGRGVGMDAVKQFLLSNGGDVSLKLIGGIPAVIDPHAQTFVAFELIVSLPVGHYVHDEPVSDEGASAHDRRASNG